MNRRQLLAGAAARRRAGTSLGGARPAGVTLNGAVQFNDDHVFTRAWCGSRSW